MRMLAASIPFCYDNGDLGASFYVPGCATSNHPLKACFSPATYYDEIDFLLFRYLEYFIRGMAFSYYSLYIRQTSVFQFLPVMFQYPLRISVQRLFVLRAPKRLLQGRKLGVPEHGRHQRIPFQLLNMDQNYILRRPQQFLKQWQDGFGLPAIYSNQNLLQLSSSVIINTRPKRAGPVTSHLILILLL